MAKRPGPSRQDLLVGEQTTAAKKRRPQTAGTLQPLGIEDKKPPVAGKKSPDVGHGIRFQSKLLMLFAVRAIVREYPSHLGTELPEFGGKFDDLIFHFEDIAGNDKKKPWRCLYLQAKHRLYENDIRNQITEKQLISDKDGDFSLPKYFRSYLDIRRDNQRGDDAIKNCIICTNIGLADKFLNKARNKSNNGIKLKELIKTEWEKNIFNFGENQLCFKLEVTGIKECRKWLKDCCTDDEIKGFFDKLIFAVKTPNERELDPILEKEVGTILKLSNAAFPSVYIMNELTNWFKNKNNIWLSPEDARQFLQKTKEIINSNDITTLSIDSQGQFGKNLEFNDNAIKELARQLKSFWENVSNKIQHIISETPKLTVVKVTSALKTLPNFENTDDYLVISSKRAKDDEDKLRKTLNVEKFHHLLVIVEEEGTNSIIYDRLIPENGKKKLIVITNNQNYNKDKLALEDKVIYEHLSDKCKAFLQAKQVQFQGEVRNVSQLMNASEANKIMNSSTIQYLLQMNDKKTEIPSFTTSTFQQSLYIKRQITFPIGDENFLRELTSHLQKECKIDSVGKIEWFVQTWGQQSNILREIKTIIQQQSSERIISENKLIDDKKFTKVIITGVAGTGKSTFLSHYYEKLKNKTPDYWVIKISLVSHSDSFLQLNLHEIDQFSAVDFLANLPAVGVNQSPFGKSLLKHRLETGDRIVLMLDGFDEVDHKCQRIVIQLIKSLNKSIHFFVTTRSHMADQLELELSQLAYGLVKFARNDQIDYLTSLWNEYLTRKKVNYEKEAIKQFASLLVDRVSETLNDQERDFIGIPLQCRILAECFKLKIAEIILKNAASNKRRKDKKNNLLSGLLKDRQNFDLAYLYRLLIDTKRHVFRNDKVKSNVDGERILNDSIDMTIKQIERHLRNLAITTIVSEQNYADMFIMHVNSKNQSDIDHEVDEKSLNDFGISFGLLDKTTENSQNSTVQFLHRTYAEYFLADCIHKALLLDNKSHNKLLHDGEFRQWFNGELFINVKYEAVRTFLDSMLKQTVDGQSSYQRFGSLPNRLQQLSFSLNARHGSKSAFYVAFEKRNANILRFIFDCFDKTLVRSEIRNMIVSVVQFVFDQRNDLFQRLLNYFNDADDDKFKEIVHGLCSNNFLNIKENLVDKEFPKSNVNSFVEFMDNHRERLKRALANHEMKLHGMVESFIRNERYDSFSEQFFKLLPYICSKDDIIVELLERGIDSYFRSNSWKSGRIQCTLTVLRKLGQNNLLIKISRLVLVKEPETFEQFYQPKKSDNKDEPPILTDSEGCGMTLLDRAAYYGDLDIFKRIQDSSYDPLKESISKDCLSSLYLVTARGHQEMCQEMLKLLQESESGSLKRDPIEFVSEPLRNAVKFNNLKMIQTILKSYKTIFGQDKLIQLLRYSSLFTQCCKNAEFFETVVRIIVQEKESNNYGHLTELVFQSKITIGSLKYASADTLQKMISANGFDVWTRRLMNADIIVAFVLLSCSLLDKIDDEQFSKLIDIITELQPLGNDEAALTSYFAKFVALTYNENTSTAITALDVLIEHAARQNNLKKLALCHDEVTGVALARRFLWTRRVINTYASWPNFPKELRTCIQNHMDIRAPLIIDTQLVSWFFSVEDHCFEVKIETLQFYLDYGNENQLLNFIEFITKHHDDDENNIQGSILDHLIESFGYTVKVYDDQLIHNHLKMFTRHLVEKLNENAVINLIFQKNSNDIFEMRPAWINNTREVSEISKCLSKANQDDILHKMSTSPGLIEIMLDDSITGWDYWTKYYFGFDSRGVARNLLVGFELLSLHFINKFRAEELEQFIRLVVSVRSPEAVRYSVWADFIDKASESTDNQRKSILGTIKVLLQNVKQKLGIAAVENLIYHNKGDGEVIFRAALNGDAQIFEALLSQYNYYDQDCIREEIFIRLGVVDSLWTKTGLTEVIQIYLVANNDQQVLFGFKAIIDYFLEKFDNVELGRFIAFIVSLDSETNKIDIGCSLWGEYIRNCTTIRKPSDCMKQIKKFLQHTLNKLGQEAVKDLVRHKDTKGDVIVQVATSKVNHKHKTSIIDVMLSHLSKEQQDGIRQELGTLLTTMLDESDTVTKP